MSRQFQDLEKRAESILASFSNALDAVPAPGEAVVERIKAAVRHELNEQWLSALPAMQPSRTLLDGVRSAIRDALRDERACAVGSRGEMPRRSGLGRWMAGFAAAAMMTVCAGLIHQVGVMKPEATSLGLNAQVALQPVDLFVEAAELALAADEAPPARLAGLREDKSSDAILDDLDEAVQDILGSSEPKDSTMHTPAARSGAMG